MTMIKIYEMMMTAAMMMVTMTMLEHVLNVDRPTRAVGGVLLKIILISLALSLIFTHLPSNAGRASLFWFWTKHHFAAKLRQGGMIFVDLCSS